MSKTFHKYVVVVLVSICIVGAFGIPLGDPKFFIQAISLESAFAVLAIVSWKNFRYAYIPNFIIAGIVIAGNTISPKHLEIMSTLNPLYNAIVLILGGYILQALLLLTNWITLTQYRKTQTRS